uniref:Uncharacterized protein, isoform A n=2 Tax=Drosophila melanogaster TaxID=7227 RepID=A0A0B4JDF8_DROME|eukprot:NP_001189239.1 uncharacterized protein Dmel_CG42779, isoform A [Drosophila melanogaster]
MKFFAILLLLCTMVAVAIAATTTTTTENIDWGSASTTEIPATTTATPCESADAKKLYFFYK